jgi:phosphohistidine phosphatase SixA
VYVTQYRRTRETAAPLVASLTLEPREIRVSGTVAEHAREIAATLIDRHRGEVVLVVGHSNTIGPIASALGANAPAELEEHEYEHLYIVSADGTSPARFMRVRFGPPNPPPRPGRSMR